jgi:hypothetical protein
MAAPGSNEQGIVKLRIKLDRAGGSPARAVFELRADDGVRLRVGAVPVGELGLPDRIRSSQDVDERRFGVPPEVVAGIRDGLAGLRPDPAAPLWLNLAPPRGYLHLVPWERLLSPALRRMILRLPNFRVRSAATGPSLRIAICASEPRAKMSFGAVDVLPMLADCWAAATGRPVFVHVFTDLASFPAVRTALAGRDGIVVADPTGAGGLPEPPRSRGSTGEITNPWLRWIRDELSGTALDVMHFVGHGYFGGDRGSLALAADPARNTDRVSARFVGGTELAEFMCRTGAWTLCLSSPEFNYSTAALRELADATAQVRPGVTMVHDLGADDRARELDTVLGTVFARAPAPPQLPAVACWCGVEFVEPAVTPRSADPLQYASVPFDDEFDLDDTRDVLARDTTPTWVAAGARVIEATQVEWAGASGDLEDPDAIAALRNVSALFNEHVRVQETGPRPPGGVE